MQSLNILLIDNDTHYKERLRALLADHNVTVLGHDAVGQEDVNNFDVIILSGGGIIDDSGQKRPLLHFTDFYRDQIELVRNTDKPIIGICLGSEIIGYAFGSKLSRPFKTRRKGVFPIAAIRLDPIMGGAQEAQVFQSNHWILTEVGPELEVIAASDEGAEIIRHRSKPIYGIQFHPERTRGKNDGPKIFKRILRTVTS